MAIGILVEFLYRIRKLLEFFAFTIYDQLDKVRGRGKNYNVTSFPKIRHG